MSKLSEFYWYCSKSNYIWYEEGQSTEFKRLCIAILIHGILMSQTKYLQHKFFWLATKLDAQSPLQFWVFLVSVQMHVTINYYPNYYLCPWSFHFRLYYPVIVFALPSDGISKRIDNPMQYACVTACNGIWYILQMLFCWCKTFDCGIILFDT